MGRLTSLTCGAMRYLLPCIALCSLAAAQVLNQDQELQVHNLPVLLARTPHSSDVLLTSLDTVFHNREICCGRDSALEDAAQAADPKSLKDVADKLNGRHLLGDGRPIKVTSQFVTPDQLASGSAIAAIANQHALLMEWNSHVYVVHGVVFFWAAYGGSDQGNIPVMVIRKFLLWDLRYSDSRRELIFNRETEDPNSLQGMLFLDWTPQ